MKAEAPPLRRHYDAMPLITLIVFAPIRLRRCFHAAAVIDYRRFFATLTFFFFFFILPRYDMLDAVATLPLLMPLFLLERHSALVFFSAAIVFIFTLMLSYARYAMRVCRRLLRR